MALELAVDYWRYNGNKIDPSLCDTREIHGMFTKGWYEHTPEYQNFLNAFSRLIKAVEKAKGVSVYSGRLEMELNMMRIDENLKIALGIGIAED